MLIAKLRRRRKGRLGSAREGGKEHEPKQQTVRPMWANVVLDRSAAAVLAQNGYFGLKKGKPLKMNRNIGLLIAVAAVVSMVVMMGSAVRADTITQVFDFESPALADGATTTATGWTKMSGTASYGVIVNPTSDKFASADGNGALPSPATGSQCLWNDAGTKSSDLVLDYTLTSSITVQPGWTYSITVSVGTDLLNASDPTNHPMWGWNEGFRSGSAYRTRDGDGFATPTPAAGTFADFNYTVTGDYLISKKAVQGAALMAIIDISTGAYMDNVRVVVTTPEPSTILLLSTGLIGLAVYTWRKRK